jgi:hypothetical protein
MFRRPKGTRHHKKSGPPCLRGSAGRGRGIGLEIAAEDLAVFDARKHEPTIGFEDFVKELKYRVLYGIRDNVLVVCIVKVGHS